MNKPAATQLVRVLVDFYQGGQLLYKKDNVYPLDERLQLLKARGDAQAYTAAAAAKAAQAGGKRNKAEAPVQPTTLPISEAAEASNIEADSADSGKNSGLKEPETEQGQSQQVTVEVASTDDQTAQA